MPSPKRKLGDIGESVALEYLKKQGYQILDRNYQKKWGEIDIVASSKGCTKKGRPFDYALKGRSQKGVPLNYALVFIEVKTQRCGESFGFKPEENIHWRKQKRLIKTAQTYLLEKNYPPETHWQIDVIVVELDLEKRRANLRHIKNAVW